MTKLKISGFSAIEKPCQKALFIAISALSQFAHAGENTDHHTHGDIEIPTISVTANPLGVENDALIVPITSLGGRELSLRRESTLGDTLNGTPGVSATRFGPNASRPVIRGLDGERVRLMQNGIGILDASSLSFDHAVGVDPLIIEQVDVVRGPAALLYGGNATGGVVNAIDFRVPQEKVNGVTGRAEMRFGGPDDTRNGAAVIDVGNGKFALHADAYARKTNELDIPGFAVSRRLSNRDAIVRNNRGKLLNSDASGEGGALGAALTFDDGYLGASFSGMDYNYGTVAEENVRIDMQSYRWDVAGEIKNMSGMFNRGKFRLAHTRYQHVELEGSEVGTTFKNRGLEGSVELMHTSLAGISGVFGMQFNNTNFSALGDEAFVPTVQTKNQALYLYEELPVQQHKISWGGRIGHTSVDSKTDARFGLGKNSSFNPNSYALGGLLQLNPTWSLASNLSHNERAPSYFELYANGAHVATGQFEIGNAHFDKERSNGVDVQLRWRDVKNHFNISGFYTRFSNFTGLFNTGNTRGTDGELNPVDLDNNGIADGSGSDILPEARFGQVPAEFKGLEFDGRFNLTDNLDMTLRGDYVHATQRRTGDYLPRIAPLRLGAGLIYQHGRFSAKLDALHAFKQNKIADSELATDSYTDVNMVLAYKLPTKFNMELFAKANNLLDEEIRDHASFLKDISPAGSRSLLLGLRGDF